MFLYGQRSVTERLKTNPQSIQRIYVLEEVRRPDIVKLARAKHVFVEFISKGKLLYLARDVHAQGVIAEVSDFVYQEFDEVLGREHKRIIMFLDRITDPVNLGAILRICACFGGCAVVLPKFESVEVNDTVVKVSCGAENHVPVSMVTNLSGAIEQAKDAGYWIGAAVVEDGVNPRKVKFNFPLGFVFGSEGEGIRPGLLKHVDYRLTVPMKGAQLSFNVATSVGIFCYEALNQKIYDKIK
ncbi:MAG: 23S rRNA (guanosine(2251)-2'-O)-methyltransferase RlmB [Candidatus Omnitrophica bacterium]|nr:23S rRNA (guanosine(2251)-2'-O)-methyltransferase RlmB [Candidatus Omnitrophota bacterium]